MPHTSVGRPGVARRRGAPVVGDRHAAGRSGRAVSGTLSGRTQTESIRAPTALLAADLNYDFRTDLVLAGAGGLRLLRQDEDGRFTDVTATTKLPAPRARRAGLRRLGGRHRHRRRSRRRAWLRSTAPPVVLRNNGDGTFTAQRPFPGVGARARVRLGRPRRRRRARRGVLDADGVVHVFLNLRGATSARHPLPVGFPTAVAMAATDLDGDAPFDLLALDPRRRRPAGLRGRERRTAGRRTSVAQVDPLAGGSRPAPRASWSPTSTTTARRSDRGRPNASSRVLLGRRSRHVQEPGTALAFACTGRRRPRRRRPARAAGPGRSGRPVRAVEQGRKGLSLAGAAPARRDRHRRPAHQLVRHRRRGRDPLRTARAEAGHRVAAWCTSASARPRGPTSCGSSGRTASCSRSSTRAAETRRSRATQRLKGSCPWLFAWNGHEMSFVTDLIWRSPLGLRINAQADGRRADDRGLGQGARRPARAAGRRVRPAHHRRALGDALLRPRRRCSSSITREDTEVFVDERFAVPPPPLEAIATGPGAARSARSRDDPGAMSSAVVRDARRPRISISRGRGAYQGMTRDHFVEMELPDDAPRHGSALARRAGLDSSDRQLGQRRHRPGRRTPRRTASSLLGGRCGRAASTTSATGLGFPAGKDKTVLVDLAGLFPADGPAARCGSPRTSRSSGTGWAGRSGRPDVAARATRGSSSRRPSCATAATRSPSRQTPSSPERPRYVARRHRAALARPRGLSTRASATCASC